MISFSTETICPVCGSSFEQNRSGRRKEYCTLNCQEFNKFLSAFENRFLKVPSMDDKRIKDIRSKLFSLANLTNGKRIKTNF